ncbi:transketolase [Glycomyces algeriensis]|uniref:Transketolase n=1 Tax=Glycomyces algeriensis TaxID=256037 RepID=A0A9W6G968_9ACTN|nr:transketolase [Glycomyces algeriensis]MDA1365142.1 transketolase [Glycomyces algeriensis]MDR7349794.1 transketolase [Glycomyces algeriensis]GLI42503.1 transketolase [Glycomyces algeriensis]
MSVIEARTSDIAELGQQLRVDAVRASARAGSGHPTSSMSAADLMAGLLTGHLHYDFDHPHLPGNDRLVFSKGHASPLLYAMLHAAGAIDEERLLTYRRLGSELEGHPTPRLPWVDVATGSLGQGLPIGVGMALGARLSGSPARVWVLCGDGEIAEGSMWEAFAAAADFGLGNLCAIVDVNRLGQTGPTRYEWDTAAYAAQIGGFGWHTVEIDGHDPVAIDKAYAEAARQDVPTAILAKTRKGKGVAAAEDREGLHGKPLAESEKAVVELGGVRESLVRVSPPRSREPRRTQPSQPMAYPSFSVGSSAATRDGFGAAIEALGEANPDVVVVDGEVADSTRTAAFKKAFPNRFFECYIAEQQMIAAAVGLQSQGWIPYASTFAAFLTRAHDFLRMAAIGGADLRVVGSHAGVSIGADGPSQMGLEDLAMFRALWRSVVLYPCDANQAAHLTATMADLPGISYLRTTRAATPVIYRGDELFPVGGSRTLVGSAHDRAVIVAAGITVSESLGAAERLADEGIPVRVIDAYSIKPLDAATIRQAAADTGRVLTVEDHWPVGGLGDAVLDAVAGQVPDVRFHKLAVRGMPGSAGPAEQMAAAGIDSAAIVRATQRLVA